MNAVPARLGAENVRRITVIGCGHVGLVMAAGFAHRGHAVTGLDRSPDLVAMLTAGVVPIHEAGLTEHVQRGIASGRLRFTTAYADAVEALRHRSATLGMATPMLSAVQQVNSGQRTNAVRKLQDALGSLAGKSIAVWGLTFNGNTEDTRESPALRVVELLLDAGARARIYDPSFPMKVPDRILSAMCTGPLEAARGADALAVQADWPQFKDVAMDTVRRAMAGNVVLDGRNVIDADAVKASGLIYIGVGRGKPTPMPAGTTPAHARLATAG